MPSSTPDPLSEGKQLRWALALELASVGWNFVAGAAAIIVGVLANSVALFSFGGDAIAAMVGAAVVVWRFYTEMRSDLSADAIGSRGLRVLTGGLMILFSIYIAAASIITLLGAGARPLASTLGIANSGASFAAAILLSRAKLACAAILASAALREEAWRTIASAWVSGITLLGLSANAAFDWWWADPVAALALIPVIGMGGFQDLFGPLSSDITTHR